MKLIDLLVKELPWRGGWPHGADECYWHHGFSHVYFYNDGCDVEYSPKLSTAGVNYNGDDEGESVIRTQYESALAASEVWIEWGGGGCPVEEDALVEVKYRNEMPFHIKGVISAGQLTWPSHGVSGDIIAYRLHKPDINSRANDDRLEQDLNECIGQDVDMPEWNGEGLPPVGCECEISFSDESYRKCTVLFTSKRTVLVAYDTSNDDVDNEEAFAPEDVQFRPLRTEAEKAREKLAASLHAAAGASPIELNGIGPLYFKLADAIISGSVFGTTFKENK